MKSSFIWSATIGLAATLAVGDETPTVRISTGFWVDVGRIMNASDTLINGDAPANVLDLNGNILQGMGGQLTLLRDLGPNMEAALGFGAYRATHAMGQGATSFLAISLFQNFITQSRLTYFLGEKENPVFSATLGAFPYKYNTDAHNLGLYLLRGPVYPGYLMGGFQDPAMDTTRGTMVGGRLHNSIADFSHDLILNVERDIPPTLDWSLAYLAKYRAFGALELGAGVNFYRLLSYNKDLREPGRMSDAQLGFKKLNYVEVGPNGDTTFFTHQGTKVMGMFSLDLKPLLGIGTQGSDDFKLYGEAAILGLKDYGTIYNDINQRIPVMLGFNLPTFGLLDRVSIEVEHYRSPYRNDLARIGNNNVVADWTTQQRPVPSPKPVTYADYGIDPQGRYVNASSDTLDLRGTALDKENLSADDFKWSLLVVKTVSKRIQFIAQAANDHYRPRPVATGLIFANGGTAEAFSSPKDWYLMFRAGYFF